MFAGLDLIGPMCATKSLILSNTKVAMKRISMEYWKRRGLYLSCSFDCLMRMAIQDALKGINPPFRVALGVLSALTWQEWSGFPGSS